ncbi:uncharacterized protein EI97DRAFT_433810 [Westerdykella ornata]|uniref:RWD domain-containing protein n=1 Tax=Westerdykella ornata TaxID=318751 RepID=A0A6A6JHH6_WESOR|nr:uncharacterized protein EI97DRAFT_433810 [Westerdykella ornata]KAF2275862.1 hypothetical protein EI97DRAFT_433810 [Westerdykella ornata]
MSESSEARLSTELELLQAMYPDQIDYNPKSRELKFIDNSALLHLRIPEHYPETALPDVLSASDRSKNDLRDRMQAAIRHLGIAKGDEALDAILGCFQAMTASTNNSNDLQGDTDGPLAHAACTREPSKTVIIWLHHLLALGKRKLAVSPSSPLSGITKPGYPGILVFTGAASAVDEHVDVLKAQNWQAFQVRFEEPVRWDFGHGGVVEVETMAEVVKLIDVGPKGSRRKEEFLRAAGIK